LEVFIAQVKASKCGCYFLLPLRFVGGDLTTPPERSHSGQMIPPEHEVKPAMAALQANVARGAGVVVAPG
jgi:hypothetical protein